MRKVLILFISVLLLAPFFRLIPARAETGNLRLKPISDAFITSGYPNSNTPSGDLSVSNNFSPDIVTKSLVKFDLNQIPAGAVIDSANFGVYVNNCSPHLSQPALYVRRLISIWSEATVTWSTNIRTTDAGMVSPSESTCAFENTIDFDVKTIVQAWASGSSNYGFLISGSESQVYEQYYFSRDHAMIYPYLEVSYSYTSASTPAPAGSNPAGTDTAAQPSGSSATSNGTSTSTSASGSTTTTPGSSATNPSASGVSGDDKSSGPTSVADAFKNPTKLFNGPWPWWKIAIASYLGLIILGGAAAGVYLLVRKIRKKK